VELKNLFVKIRDTINELDQLLSFVMIIDIIDAMIAVMNNIYAFSLSNNNLFFKKQSKSFAYRTISSIVKLVISCYINGLVHEQSERIYAVLDKFNAKQFDKSEYKELVLFKTMSRESSFGFTIGGFAALRKTTLIPVIN